MNSNQNAVFLQKHRLLVLFLMFFSYLSFYSLSAVASGVFLEQLSNDQELKMIGMEAAINLSKQKAIEEGIDISLYAFDAKLIVDSWLVSINPIREPVVVGDGYVAIVSRKGESVLLLPNE